MKMPFIERAKLLVAELDEKGVDQVQIALAAGVTKGTVNQWLTGGIQSMKMEYGLGIEKAYGYNHRWLVMGEEPKKISKESPLHGRDLGEPTKGYGNHGLGHWPFAVSWEEYDKMPPSEKDALNKVVCNAVAGYWASPINNKSKRNSG